MYYKGWDVENASSASQIVFKVNDSVTQPKKTFFSALFKKTIVQLFDVKAFSNTSNTDDAWSSTSASSPWSPEKSSSSEKKTKVNGAGWDAPADSDPFFSPSSGVSVTGGLSEDDQVAWAKFDSIKIDQQRRDLAQREEAELQLAINLSLTETKPKESGPI